MYRFFESITRPLLDAVEPSVVVEIGSDKGPATELLVEWCQEHGAVLHCVDPLPKYDADEWSARWPETLVFHRGLSLDALVDIGPADFVCIDGDHNWYTVFHELEILGRQSRQVGRPFPLTLLHDVAWPYGRRDVYYDPQTIPEEFRNPHRKGGLEVGNRELLKQGFNDHLETAIDEGTPKNGVLTAAEDFVAGSEDTLILNVVPGLHGLGIISSPALGENVAEVLSELASGPGLSRVVEAVELDRLGTLQSLSKLRGDLKRERTRAAETDALRGQRDDLRRQNTELRLESERVQEELASSRSSTKAAEDRANRTDERYRQAVVAHDEESLQLREQLIAVERDLIDLRNRRSVRLALRAASLARPVFQIRRGGFGRRKSGASSRS